MIIYMLLNEIVILMSSYIASGFLFDRKWINMFCHYKSFSAAGLIFTRAIIQTRLHPCVYNQPINLVLCGKNIREYLTEEKCDRLWYIKKDECLAWPVSNNSHWIRQQCVSAETLFVTFSMKTSSCSLNYESGYWYKLCVLWRLWFEVKWQPMKLCFP